MNPQEPVVGIPFCPGVKHFRDTQNKAYMNRWINSTSCRQAKMLLEKWNPKRTKELLGMARTEIRAGISILTEHSKADLHKMV